MKRTLPGAAMLLAGLASFSALAQDAMEEAAEAVVEVATLDTGDTAWMMVSTVIVLMMAIPGLALFYGGMVRKANVLTMVMQCFAIVCVMSVLWMVVGYSLAFGDGGPYVGDLSRFFLAGLTVDSMSGTIPESVFMTFQMTFAAITPALIVGAFADRMKFGPMLVFMVLWSLIVYSPTVHWVWHENGFLFEDGVLDFAGGTVVHINAGIAGLVACIILGRRTGYGTATGHVFAPHNLVYSLIGASLLWVGWFGFNAGSALSAGQSAGMAMAVTQIAAAAGGLGWMFLEWMAKGKPSVLGIITGAIAGLVAITPAAGFVTPSGALIIGIASGVICYVASTSLKRALGYDDSLDVFGVHGVGGIVGALLTGVLASPAINPDGVGLLYGNAEQLWIQFKSVVISVVWCGLATAVILLVVRAVMGLRVSEEAERDGLDLALHGESVQ